MATLAAVTLTFPGTPLDRAWKLNPRAYQEMAPRGGLLGPFFFVLAAVLFAAAIGWLKRRRWGWFLTVAIISTQILGDLINAFRGDYLRGLVGFLIASALMLYLVRSRVRHTFRTGPV
jgi:hypothetical protein